MPRVLSGSSASTSGASTPAPWCVGEARRRAAPSARRPRPRQSSPAAAGKARLATATATTTARPRRRRQRLVRVSASSSSSSQPPPPQLFSPPPFDPAKLTVTLLPGVARVGREIVAVGGGGDPSFPLPRRYTLTHNDVTGALALSIGSRYNAAQLEGWYVRMIRDEVLAEWRREEVEVGDGDDESDDGRRRRDSKPTHSLHVFCHVSGDARWLAPPRLRSRIFQREMALVLDTIAHADSELLRAFPELAASDVVVHLRSHVASLDARVVWGSLGDRSGWREPPRLLDGLLEGVVGDLWRGLGGGTELRADLGGGDDGSGFDDGTSSSSSASAADFYYDGSSSVSAIDDEEMGALMSDDGFIAMAERDTSDDDEGEGEREASTSTPRQRTSRSSALRL